MLAHIRTKLEKKVQEVIYFSKGFNYNYMEFFGFDISEKLIATSGKGCRNKNTISTQSIKK